VRIFPISGIRRIVVPQCVLERLVFRTWDTESRRLPENPTCFCGLRSDLSRFNQLLSGPGAESPVSVFFA